jgi:AcrR family transcriptional regulator
LTSTNKRRSPSLRDQQRSFTRARLLESAAAIIAREGLTHATVADIAGNANASRATFYLHFKDKDDLLAALIDEVQPDVADYYSRLDEVIAGGDRLALRAWVVDALRWFAEHETTVRALEQALLTRSASFPLPASRFTTHMPKYAGSWPELDSGQAELRVWSIVQLLSRLSLLRSKGGGHFADLGDDDVSDVLVDIIWGTLRLDRLASAPGDGA